MTARARPPLREVVNWVGGTARVSKTPPQTSAPRMPTRSHVLFASWDALEPLSCYLLVDSMVITKVPVPVSWTSPETMQLDEGAGTTTGNLSVTCPLLLPTPPPFSVQSRSQLTNALCDGVAESARTIREGLFAVPLAIATA